MSAVFKSRKPRTAAVRQKETDDDHDQDAGAGVSPMLAASQRKKERTKSKAKLSFQDETEEPFVPRKSTLSQSISLQKLAHQNTAVAPIPAAATSTSAYNTDYLAQLKASTPTRSTLAREPDVVIPYDDDADAETPVGIPDEAAIASAITRRRRAQGQPPTDTSEADYISLSADASRLAVYDPSTARGPHPESRLQRESDSEGSGDETLAAFTGSKDRLGLRKGLEAGQENAEHARRIRREMRDAVDDDDFGMRGEGDEDEERWEVEQVRRAGAAYDPAPLEKPSYTSAKIPLVRPLPTTTAAATRLTTSLSYLLAGQTTTSAQLDANARERERLDEQEREVRSEVERVEAKREWMQEFVGWIELLGGFLEDKVPVLDQIESDGAHHWSQRKEMITRRRRQDDTDDVALFLGVAPSEEQVDEMGRTRSDDAGPHATVRKYRRQARLSRRERRGKPPTTTTTTGDTSDGYSTDATLDPADEEDYSAAQKALRARAEALDDDVKAEEFLDPARGIGRRFAEWRQREEEEYQAAFGGLGCVQGWEYWARKEMVGWEPSRSNRSVDAFDWFHALYAYSHPHRPRQEQDMDVSDDEEPPLAPEGDMAGAMIASLVTRLVERAIKAGEYDVYSNRQTRRLSGLVDLISCFTDKQGQKYKALLKAVLGAFLEESQSLATLVSSALAPTATPPSAFDPASRAALATFTNRRLKLIKNMLVWRRYAPEEIKQLVGMVLGQVIRPCLTRCWDSGGKELADKVMRVVPENIMSVDVVAFFKAAK